MDKTMNNMFTKEVTIKEEQLKDYILENFREGAVVEISYNRVFVPGKILFIDESANLTLQLKGQLLNQTIDLVIDEVINELVEIIYSYGDDVIKISITD